MICKMTALLEYLDLLLNFYERNFHDSCIQNLFYNENKAS